jgi:hypothetical protein
LKKCINCCRGWEIEIVKRHCSQVPTKTRETKARVGAVFAAILIKPTIKQVKTRPAHRTSLKLRRPPDSLTIHPQQLVECPEGVATLTYSKTKRRTMLRPTVRPDRNRPRWSLRICWRIFSLRQTSPVQTYKSNSVLCAAHSERTSSLN